MSDEVRDTPTRVRDFLQSTRTVVEGLILGGIFWLGSSVQQQNNNIIRLQVQVATLQTSLANVPEVARQVSVNQTEINDLKQRLQKLENR